MGISIDHLRDTFRAKGRRLTSQRRLVLNVLQSSGEHLDAETLYQRAKARDPDISLATVYRTLAVLSEMGLVEEHKLGEGHSHYEAVRETPHYHFVCLSCGKIIEFDAPMVKRIQDRVCQQEGVCVVDAHLRLTGYCAGCKDDGFGGQNCDGK